LSERDSWRVLQNFFADSLICPIYERALLMALTSGQIEGLSERDYSRLVYKEISGRNWHWVDPVRDIEAKEREVALGINSRQNIAREAGRPDFSVIVKENVEDKNVMIDLGLVDESSQVTDGGQPASGSTVSERMNAYGIGVRAGAITPQIMDEESFRNDLSLPAMGPDAKEAWVDDDGVRRPITLASKTQIDAEIAADETDSVKEI
jgi:hypothetical protein